MTDFDIIVEVKCRRRLRVVAHDRDHALQKYMDDGGEFMGEDDLESKPIGVRDQESQWRVDERCTKCKARLFRCNCTTPPGTVFVVGKEVEPD